MKDPSFPRAILHVDGDYFFVSCELASKPWFKGRSVVTGHERGIATAMSPEAKALGVTRGMPVYRIRKVYPQVVILHSDYDSYAIYANRMYSIVRRYTPDVEEYSIDECFADITDSPERFKMGYEEIARTIKSDLEAELGLSFSVGVSVNKVLAKAASKWSKPSGLTMIPKDRIPAYLEKIPIGKIWGIGRSTSMMLRKQGIETALQFTEKGREWAEASLAKPCRELYEELCGASTLGLGAHGHRENVSISRTRTFTPASKDKAFIYAQLSKNVEAACLRLRRQGFFARWFSFFLKSQEFRYYRLDVRLPRPTATPAAILSVISRRFGEIFVPGILYRASGITVGDLVGADAISGDLFNDEEAVFKLDTVYKAVDRISRRYGSHSVFLGSSWKAVKGESIEPRHLGIPFLGEAR